MFNKPTAMLRDLYKYSFIDRIFIRMQTRALGARFERLFILLPVIIHMGNNNQKLLDNTKEYLTLTLQPHNIALKIYDRVVLRLLAYNEDNDMYMQDRQKLFEILKQNIQLYTIIDSVLDDEFLEQKKMIIDIIKKQYDETYSTDEHGRNLLFFQEEHYM